MLDESAIKHMVERFLSWKLPENFNPDGGISFQRVFNENTPHPMKAEPSGTNLFDYNQAKSMVLHMLEGLPVQAAARPAVTVGNIVSQIAIWSDDEGLDLSYGQGDDLARRILSALSAHPCTTSPVVDHETANVSDKPKVVDEIASIIGYHLASIVSGNNQPCMSGDPRDRIQPARRRHFDRACLSAAEAITAALRQHGKEPSDAR